MTVPDPVVAPDPITCAREYPVSPPMTSAVRTSVSAFLSRRRISRFDNLIIIPEMCSASCDLFLTAILPDA